MKSISFLKRLRQRGSALMAALFCIMLVGFAAAALATIISQEMNMHQRVTNGLRAKRLARGGAERALAWLLGGTAADGKNYKVASPTLPSALKNPDFEELSSSQSCSVTFEPNAVGAVGVEVPFRIISTATVNGVTATSTVLLARKPHVSEEEDPDAANYISTLEGMGVFTDGSVLGSGSFGLKGNADLKVHSNGDLTVNGNAFAVDMKNISSAKIADIKHADSSYTITSNAPIVEFPKMDWEAMKTMAKASPGGVNYFATTAAFLTMVNSSGGVFDAHDYPVYVEGTSSLLIHNVDITINNGPLIFNGSVSPSSKKNKLVINTPKLTTATGVVDSPIGIAFASGEWSVAGNGENLVDGYIYSETGSVTYRGNAALKLKGGLILGGTLDVAGTPDFDITPIKGGLDLLVIEPPPPEPPPVDGSTIYDSARVVGWME